MHHSILTHYTAAVGLHKRIQLELKVFEVTRLEHAYHSYTGVKAEFYAMLNIVTMIRMLSSNWNAEQCLAMLILDKTSRYC